MAPLGVSATSLRSNGATYRPGHRVARARTSTSRHPREPTRGQNAHRERPVAWASLRTGACAVRTSGAPARGAWYGASTPPRQWPERGTGILNSGTLRMSSMVSALAGLKTVVEPYTALGYPGIANAGMQYAATVLPVPGNNAFSVDWVLLEARHQHYRCRSGPLGPLVQRDRRRDAAPRLAGHHRLPTSSGLDSVTAAPWAPCGTGFGPGTVPLGGHSPPRVGVRHRPHRRSGRVRSSS